MLSATRLFRIVYKTFYFLLYILLLLLLLVSPADIIYQSLWVPPRYEFFVIVLSAAYLVTVLIVSFVYSMRLWINRGVLAAIPRSRIPVDVGDVPPSVRKMIVAGLSRSAAIALDARPRVLPPSLTAPCGTPGDQSQGLQFGSLPAVATSAEGEARAGKEDSKKKGFGFSRIKKTSTVETKMGIDLPPHKPVWGEIEHNGWGSPLSPDFPGLEYGTVVLELPNLIEAKALTLAPQILPLSAASLEGDQGSGGNGSQQQQQQEQGHIDDSQMVPDPEAMALLQRGNMGMRDYLANLAELGVLPPSQTAAEFLVAYEQARFSTRPMSALCFRELMHLFADVFRSMVPLDPAVLYAQDDYDEQEEHDKDSFAESAQGSDLGHSGRSSDMDIDDDAPAATASPSTFGSPGQANSSGARLRGQGSSTPRSSSPVISMRTDSSADSRSVKSLDSSTASHIRHHHHHHHNRRRRQARHQHPPGGAATARTSPSKTWQYRTAPTTPKDLRMSAPDGSPSARMAAAAAAVEAALSSLSPSSSSSSLLKAASLKQQDSASSLRHSDGSFAHTRHPYPISQASSGSLRSLASSGSVVVRPRDR